MTPSRISQPFRFLIITGACFALLGALLMWSMPSVEAAPRTQPGIHATFQDGAYRTQLHAGECETLDLPNVLATADATPESGSAETSWSWSFAMTIDGSLGDMIATPHSLSIEVAEGDLATTVACGELAGEIVGTRLVVPLTATETGELAGIAVLSERDDATIMVDLYLILSADGSPLRPVEDTDPALDDAGDDEEDEENPEGGV